LFSYKFNKLKMGKVVSGIALGFSGKVGDHVFTQQPNGETHVQQAPQKSDLPPTEKQLGNRQEIALNSVFVKVVGDFLAVGFALQGKTEKLSGANSATRYNRKQAFVGEYPDRRMDFSKVLVSKGNMPAPTGAAVSKNEFGFVFTWDTKSEEKGTHYSDQVMLLVYFPEIEKAEYIIAASQRSRGTEMLSLGRIASGNVGHVYISFIEDNRKSVSDSVYLGQLIW
jgi:hypothetical protein